MYKPSIARCPLYAGIEEENLRSFFSDSVSEIATFKKGDHIVRQGDSINYLYLLVEGIVRTEMITAEGNLVEIEFIESVRPLAPAFIFANRNKFPVDVIAMETCEVYLIPKSAFL